jgi:phosphoribosylaminoimidazole-succinocarboxamide synthase
MPILIDEALTPDSSRFWPADAYEPGHAQPSFDKQFVREYLETLVADGAWDKTAPGPELPAEIAEKTLEKYAEAVRLLTS